LVAGPDFDRARDIARWPLVEVLVCYLAIERERALRIYQHRELVWNIRAPYVSEDKRGPYPEVPPILKDIYVDE
jgi:hypothetical protein